MSGQLYSNEKNSLQQIQMESCQPIKRLKKEEEEVLVLKESDIEYDKKLRVFALDIRSSIARRSTR